MDTLTLTYWQRRRLEQQLRSTHDARVYRRTLAVLEVAPGEPVASVARRLRVTPRAVYHWVAAYARDRDPGCPGRPRPPRPAHPARPAASATCSANSWADTPAGAGLPRRRVDRAPAPAAPGPPHRPACSPTTPCGGRSQRLRYTWKRPRYRLDPDPELRGKKDAYPPAHQAVAAPERGAGRGRDRPAAVPAAAVRLVARGASPRRSCCAGATPGGWCSGR